LQNLLHLSLDAISSPEDKVCDFITANKKWDIDRLQRVITDQSLLHKILGVPLPVSDIQDSLIWGCTSSGKFSMQSATWLAHGIHPSSASLWPYAWIWKLDTMPKILVFIWQLCRNALPVHLLLQSRGVALDPLCPLCGQSNESMQHLFLACPNTLRVWDAAEDHNWIPQGFLRGTHAEIAGLLLTWQQHPLQLIRQRISFLLWSIWKARNNVVFNHEAFHPITCLIKAKRAGRNGIPGLVCRLTPSLGELLLLPATNHIASSDGSHHHQGSLNSTSMVLVVALLQRGVSFLEIGGVNPYRLELSIMVPPPSQWLKPERCMIVFCIPYVWGIVRLL